MDSWIIFSLAGGALIALASIAFLGLSGRILGVSGIVFGLLPPRSGDRAWRVTFFLGLVVGGLLARGLALGAPPDAIGSLPLLAAAGLLVGFGARLGSGCTSGHGICGVGRLSARSIVATVCFIAAGAVTVYITRHVIGG